MKTSIIMSAVLRAQKVIIYTSSHSMKKHTLLISSDHWSCV